MNLSGASYLRHELRGFLNLIFGYTDLLIEELQTHGVKIYDQDLAEILNAGEELKEKIKHVFSAPSEYLREKGVSKIKQELYSPLYLLIASAQDAKDLAKEKKDDQVSADFDKILKSTGNILDLLDWFFERLTLDDLAEEAALTTSSEMTELPEDAKGVQEERNAEGVILVIDDNEMNRDLLSRHLSREGYTIVSVETGTEAFSLLRDTPCDLIILDIMMPDMNGYKVLELLKFDKILRHIPVIIMSALEDMQSIIHCIEMGAEDYLPKIFNPVLLKARVGASIEKKRLRDNEQQYVKALLESQRILERELSDAAQYVRSLLPPPMDGEIRSRWTFNPSAQLGGDSFGYHCIDEETLAIYFIDVSGHGIGAALLSVSVMNLLRSQAFLFTDYSKPTDVVRTLNRTFQMEKQNDMFFTLWYGIYNKKERILRYAGGGSPPAVLMRPEEERDHISGAVILESEGTAIGFDNDAEYPSKEIQILPGSRLYLFSDGMYEIRKKNGKMMELSEFVNLLNLLPKTIEDTPGLVFKEIMGIAGSQRLEDDASLIEFLFL